MFTVTIDTDNAAFAADPAAEVARILRVILGKVEGWDGDTTSNVILDVNGNPVGHWTLEASTDWNADELNDEWDGVDQRVYPEDEEAADLLATSERYPEVAFTADGSSEPERPQG